MKNIRDLLEKKGEKAHKQAVAMGLKYKGFGYWVDPSTGQVTHKTEGDQLVSVDPDVTAEKAGKDVEGPGGAPSGGFGNAEGGLGASLNTFQNKQLPIGTGLNIQGVSPDGVAQAPNSDEGRWEPGPDGDNMVDDQELKSWNKPPKDSYVGKKNFYGWTAGPDGENYTKLTMQDMMKAALNMQDQSVDREGNIYEAEDPGAQTLYRKAMGFDKLSADDPSHVKRGAEAFQGASPSIQNNMMMKLMNRQGDKDGLNYALDRMPDKIADKKNRQERIKAANAGLDALVQDRDYDMSQRGEEIGSGIFGKVFESKDGKNVIKEGKIGPKELSILNKLKDVKEFPNLINAEIKSPFESVDDIYNYGSDSQQDAVDSDGGPAFFNNMPFADATIAMSKMQGRPYREVESELTSEGKQELMQKVHAARAAMHKLGISHNDMHGENFFVDDDGNPSILDLGMADDDPLTALMEGLGSLSGNDTQLTRDAQFKDRTPSPWGNEMNFIPDALRAKMEENVGNVREALSERLMDQFDPDDEDAFDGVENKLAQIMRGGIRLTPGRLADLREQMPFLEDNDTVLDLIKNLYDNVSQTETGQRMSNAFDRLNDDKVNLVRDRFTRKRQNKEIMTNYNKLKNALDPDD